MEPLEPSDPSGIADHRLLCRLGAGGMGVVYLARAADGSLVALKAVRAELAEDAGFRARFRREVAIARRVDGPWVVPVVAADPEAATPWAASPYVSGPSLVEAVAGHGPLPAGSVRVLGARLAAALGAVHAAGLVHRDVKPGNVLLALDGPRLIDFGIARAPDDTELTATGVVVGTPGYLAPEQAGAGGGREIGPAADVFALGCVLVYAATGRPPFGTGPTDALLFRAVHDAPDLSGVAGELLPHVRSCLEKSPASRPDAASLARALGGPAGHADTRYEGADWLPDVVVRLVAERSAAATALPDAEPTEVDAVVSSPPSPSSGAARLPDEDAAPRRTGPSRRRALALGGAAVAVVGGGAAAALLTGRGGPARGEHVIAVHGDLSGEGSALGLAQERGVRLAAAEFNSRDDRPFDLSVRSENDGGDPGRAETAARALVRDPSVLAVVGPTTTSTALAALPVYDGALLPVLAVSPGSVRLYRTGARSLLHMRPHDSLLPAYLAAHLRGQAGSRKVGIISDRAGGAAGWEISSTIAGALHAVDHPLVPAVASSLSDDFGPIVDALLDGGADSIAFAGGYQRGALLARELRDRRFTGARVGGGHFLDLRFLTAAGKAADGWVTAAPYTDSDSLPSAKVFSAAYRKRHGSAPPYGALEAYDAALFAVRTLVGSPSDVGDRAALTTALRSATYSGITKEYAFDPRTGALATASGGVSLWRADRGAFRYLGLAVYGSA
ncbi:bifunctional serine/threonine-protein kinase/ABC transporter substrate-binding protein [Streptomyces sp. NPDC007007]|uniref:bifunctional serine/threonine-protein kinase/ABC transporter substrate-binding protein n=1 Tax=Streptomyces sp. NPDC007007 TaxID=3364770 RepID=UPI00368EB6DF